MTTICVQLSIDKERRIREVAIESHDQECFCTNEGFRDLKEGSVLIHTHVLARLEGLFLKQIGGCRGSHPGIFEYMLLKQWLVQKLKPWFLYLSPFGPRFKFESQGVQTSGV